MESERGRGNDRGDTRTKTARTPTDPRLFSCSCDQFVTAVILSHCDHLEGERERRGRKGREEGGKGGRREGGREGGKEKEKRRVRGRREGVRERGKGAGKEKGSTKEGEKEGCMKKGRQGGNKKATGRVGDCI